MKPMAKLSSKYYTLPPTTCTYFPKESAGHLGVCPVQALKLLKMLRRFMQRRAARGMRKQTKNKEKFNKNKGKDLEGKTKLFNENVQKTHVLEISTYIN